MFWTTPKKIALTIALAVIAWMLFGCSHRPGAAPQFDSAEDTNLDFLATRYRDYNVAYFQNKLTYEVTVSFDLKSGNMAETGCTDDGIHCDINFNPRYALAQRVSSYLMLHEMCHIKLWTKHLEEKPDMKAYFHDKEWRACMLTLDAAGAFREINIDGYTEK